MAVLTEGKPGKEENKTRWIAQIVRGNLIICSELAPLSTIQAAGLDALHGFGIIHRDVKPENLMIDYRDNIRISDFGASYVNAGRERLHAAGRYTDEVLGTWPYTAPEVMDTRGKPKHSRRGYGTAVDYWALGCIVFELESPGSPVGRVFAWCCVPLNVTDSLLYSCCLKQRLTWTSIVAGSQRSHEKGRTSLQ